MICSDDAPLRQSGKMELNICKMFNLDSDTKWPSLYLDNPTLDPEKVNDEMLKVIYDKVLTPPKGMMFKRSSSSSKKKVNENERPLFASVTAYNMFVQEFRVRVKGLDPEVKVKYDDVFSNSECGRSWMNLTDEQKNLFQKSADGEKKRCDEHIKNNMPQDKDDPLPMPGVVVKMKCETGRHWFYNDLRPILSSLHPHMDSDEIANECRLRWLAVGSALQKKYEIIEQLDKKLVEQEK